MTKVKRKEKVGDGDGEDEGQDETNNRYKDFTRPHGSKGTGGMEWSSHDQCLQSNRCPRVESRNYYSYARLEIPMKCESDEKRDVCTE